MTAIRSPNSASLPEATNASNTVASKSKSSSTRPRIMSSSPTTSSNRLIFASRTRSTCSSMVPLTTRLVSSTSCSWPTRCRRPSRRSICIAVRGRTRPGQLRHAAQREPPGLGGRPALSAYPRGEVVVPVAFLPGRLDAERLRQALREQHAHLAAPVPDHHLGSPFSQRRDVPRFLARRPRADAMRRAELRRGPQQPGRDQAHHLIQVLQPVLHRRGGEQQQMPRPELADQPSRSATRRTHPVRLVHDDQVPLVTDQRGLEGIAARGGQRSEHARPSSAYPTGTHGVTNRRHPAWHHTGEIPIFPYGVAGEAPADAGHRPKRAVVAAEATTPRYRDFWHC